MRFGGAARIGRPTRKAQPPSKKPGGFLDGAGEVALVQCVTMAFALLWCRYPRWVKRTSSSALIKYGPNQGNQKGSKGPLALGK